METKITAADLAKSLSDILNRVRYRGERFLIERNGEPVAAVTPIAAVKGVSVAELFERLRAITWPDEAFADDLDSIQTNQPQIEFPEWPS